jgi:phosphoribosylaminoimidazolecarboxamide formyltransferase/IMP cyclohydrolase
MTIALRKHAQLSYGENKHQQAAFYVETGIPQRMGPSLISANQLGGKALSFNDILDLDSALSVVSDFAEPTITIIKHNNPCGLASHEDLTEAYRRALAGDPVAAFGGVVASNRIIDLATAQEISETFYNCILAPEYEPEALALLKRKRDLRILVQEDLGEVLGKAIDFRRVKGGFLAQTLDSITEKELSPQIQTQRQPTSEEWRDLLFAWRAVRHIKSNGIVIAKDKALLGMGAGQPSRVASVEIALKIAEEQAQGSILASDAFFPFADGVEVAAKGGVTAIIQPGGSVRDEEVIKVANQHNMAMVFTRVRHFRH